MKLWSRGLVRSRDKLNRLYLHYLSVYDYRTWKNGDSLWETLTHKVTCKNVFLQEHVTNWKQYISSTTVPMSTKLVRLVTYLERLQPIYLLDPLVMWFWKIKWQTKTNNTQYHCTYGQQTGDIGDLPWGAPMNIATWTFNYVVLLDHVTN